MLVITIGAGCVFGMLGLVLAAPLTSAGVHIAHDLGSARLKAKLEAETTATADLPPPVTEPTAT